jgi:hypothetical protein
MAQHARSIALDPRCLAALDMQQHAWRGDDADMPDEPASRISTPSKTASSPAAISSQGSSSPSISAAIAAASAAV